MQKVLFPGTHMRITQDEYGSTSHRGSLARDDGGESTAFDSPVIAPFDGHFARIRKDSSHETYFVSDGPVECANGYVGAITFLYMHDNNVRWKAGDHAKQGEIIGYEGGFGGGKADKFAHHTHREWSQGEHTTQAMNAYGTYCIAEQMHEYDVCFLRPDTQVYNGEDFVAAGSGTIKDNCGHTFKILEEAEKVKPLSSDPITMQIGPASAGDRVTIKSLAASLRLGYSEDKAGLMLVGPASSGDQVLVLTKAAELGLPYSIYQPEDDLEEQLAEAIKRAEAAEAQAAAYLAKINAAREALT